MRSSGPLAAAAAAALVLILAGCTGTAADTTTGELTYEDSPMTKYLDAAWSGGLSEEESEKKQAADMTQMEEIIAQCMTAEGFEYTPVDFETTDTIVVGTGDEWDIDDRAWVEKYGYGLFEFPGSDAEPEESESESTSIDENAEYIASLSESEAAAYDEALYGPPIEEEALNDPDFEYSWEESGCAGQAQHEVQGEDPLATAEFDDLFERISSLSEQAMDSTEQQELDARWAACMADAGESGFTRQSDAQQSITDDMPVPEEAPEGSETAVPDDKVVPETAETRALHEREIELALVDLTCREETDYAQSTLEIQFALEERFIEDNRAELDAFVLAAEQAE